MSKIRPVYPIIWPAPGGDHKWYMLTKYGVFDRISRMKTVQWNPSKTTSNSLSHDDLEDLFLLTYRKSWL